MPVDEGRGLEDVVRPQGVVQWVNHRFLPVDGGKPVRYGRENHESNSRENGISSNDDLLCIILSLNLLASRGLRGMALRGALPESFFVVAHCDGCCRLEESIQGGVYLSR